MGVELKWNRSCKRRVNASTVACCGCDGACRWRCRVQLTSVTMTVSVSTRAVFINWRSRSSRTTPPRCTTPPRS